MTHKNDVKERAELCDWKKGVGVGNSASRHQNFARSI